MCASTLTEPRSGDSKQGQDDTKRSEVSAYNVHSKSAPATEQVMIQEQMLQSFKCKNIVLLKTFSAYADDDIVNVRGQIQMYSHSLTRTRTSHNDAGAQTGSAAKTSSLHTPRGMRRARRITTRRRGDGRSTQLGR